MRRRKAIGFSVSTFLPSITISPDVGSIRRFTMRKSVVLPEPEVPTSIQVLPSGSAKVTASTAGLLDPGYCFVISWKAIFAILLLLQCKLHHFLPIICNNPGNCKTSRKEQHRMLASSKQAFCAVLKFRFLFPQSRLSLRLSLYVSLFFVVRLFDVESYMQRKFVQKCAIAFIA